MSIGVVIKYEGHTARASSVHTYVVTEVYEYVS